MMPKPGSGPVVVELAHPLPDDGRAAKETNMTREDLELIAAALFAAREDCRAGWVGGDGGSYLENAEAGVDAVVDQLVARLVETNIRFDAGRFRKACGE